MGGLFSPKVQAPPPVPEKGGPESQAAIRQRKKLMGARQGAASSILTSETEDTGFGISQNYLGAG